jgi:hypothetical protein
MASVRYSEQAELMHLGCGISAQSQTFGPCPIFAESIWYLETELVLIVAFGQVQRVLQMFP